MDVECTLLGNGSKIPDNTEGNRVLVIKNDTSQCEHQYQGVF